MKIKIPNDLLPKFITFIEIGLQCLEQNGCKDINEDEEELLELLRKLVKKYGE